jgi:hypothetical protein
MPRFNAENVADALELQQLVADWCDELDTNHGKNVTQYFTEDCKVRAGTISYDGHEGMKAFYKATHEAQTRTYAETGREARHLFTNLRIAFAGADKATVHFVTVMFSSPGRPPIPDATVPAIVTDVRFECRRDAKKDWRVAEFYGTPIFIGSDPFLKKVMLEKA